MDTVRGNERNKLCSCGSGKKSKRCLCREIERAHQEALQENDWFNMNRCPCGSGKDWKKCSCVGVAGLAHPGVKFGTRLEALRKRTPFPISHLASYPFM